MEYRELAEKSGIEHWRRVPALNTDERFIADMADMVVSSFSLLCLTICVQYSSNKMDENDYCLHPQFNSIHRDLFIDARLLVLSFHSSAIIPSSDLSLSIHSLVD
jgi:Ferrochelatase